MHYFAYGSSMNFEHMRRLCGWHFTILGPATLPGFEFGVDTRGYVNIRPKAGERVLGVLYEIDQPCLDIMDEYEGYPQVFGRSRVLVTGPNGQNHEAWVYLEKPEDFGGKFVKSDHLKIILAGAVENRLPETWLKFLESLRQPD